MDLEDRVKMNLRNINIALLLTLSLGTVFSGQASFEAEPLSKFFTEIPGNVESFVKENPKAAAAIIVGLASVIIFKDVLVGGVKRVVKEIKKNPVVSIGSSVVIAGLVYGCWDYYRNQNRGMLDQAFRSVDKQKKSILDAFSAAWVKARHAYGAFCDSAHNMTHESGNAVRKSIAEARELLNNA